MKDAYWKIFCDEAVEDVTGVSLTQEQRDALLKAILSHRDMEYEGCGYHEADKSVRRMNDKEQRNVIVAYVERLADALHSADGRIFGFLKEHEKLGLARIMNFREYLRREEKIEI